MRDKASFPKLKSPAILSPMAGVTDVAFRALCKRYGAGLTSTEFVSGTAIVRDSERAKYLLRTDPIEKPVAVQLFGKSFDDVVEAACQVEDLFDVIDVNCGCPAWKVIKTGAGSELLKRPEGIARLINRLAGSISKPVTLKIRSGIDEKHINAVQVAKLAQDAGAAAIAVHGRTQKQGYKGEADWELIKRVKQSVEIPVIGNGDVFSPETFKKRLEESGVDAIMIARGAIGRPGIFKQVNDHLAHGSYPPIDHASSFSEYHTLAKKYSLPFAALKQHAMHFTKGTTGGARVREEISRAKDEKELLRVFTSKKFL